MGKKKIVIQTDQGNKQEVNLTMDEYMRLMNMIADKDKAAAAGAQFSQTQTAGNLQGKLPNPPPPNQAAALF